MESDLSTLVEALRPYALAIDKEARRRLLLFSRELLTWNNRLNLLSRADAPNVIRKHVAASIGVLLVTQGTAPGFWIDVGTGAGFPGLILKVLEPALNMTLLDSARKRCLFLENILRQLELGGVAILPLRVETLVSRGQDLGHYSILTARAVSSLSETVRNFGPLLARNGQLITFKGPHWHEELEAAVNRGDLEAAGFTVSSVTRIPWTAGHLLSLRKV